MKQGQHLKFQELQEAYDLVYAYMDSFEFLCTEEEFMEQNPFFSNYKNWK